MSASVLISLLLGWHRWSNNNKNSLKCAPSLPSLLSQSGTNQPSSFLTENQKDHFWQKIKRRWKLLAGGGSGGHKMLHCFFKTRFNYCISGCQVLCTWFYAFKTMILKRGQWPHKAWASEIWRVCKIMWIEGRPSDNDHRCLAQDKPPPKSSPQIRFPTYPLTDNLSNSSFYFNGEFNMVFFLPTSPSQNPHQIILIQPKGGVVSEGHQAQP